MNKPILIIGGGIGGLCTAIALHRQGIPVQVYEKVPHLSGVGAGLLIAPNALKALAHIGIAEAVIDAGQQLDAIEILSWRGKSILKSEAPAQFQAREGLGTLAIHRGDLHEVLLSLLPAEKVHTSKTCVRVEELDEGVRAFFEDGTEVLGRSLIATDGIHSAVRQQLFPQTQIRYSGYTCWRGVMDLPVDGPGLERATETWGPNGRFGIVPLSRNRVYWFATKNAPAEDPHMGAYTVEDLTHNFQAYHEPIAYLLKHTQEENLLWNDIVDFAPLRRFTHGRVCLSGDAAHATTPNMGQGACMAIEDAAVLASCFHAQADLPAAFQEFERRRLARTRWIVKTSWRLGKIAQWENTFMCRLRDGMLRLVPDRVSARQFEKLMAVEF